MEKKQPTKPRHMVSVTAKTIDELEEIKNKLQSKMGIRLTYTQVIGILINHYKETSREQL